MLVLMRKPGQVLHIGDDVNVTILRVDGNQVRIGIDAPKDIQIVRDEAKTDKSGAPRDFGGGNR